MPSSKFISDNTILIRTGKSDFGQSTIFTAYRQIVADELYVPFEAIATVISADTDRTPDGGGTFDLLGHGMPNIRKAGAYVYQSLLDLASKQLNFPRIDFPSRMVSSPAAANPSLTAISSKASTSISPFPCKAIP